VVLFEGLEAVSKERVAAPWSQMCHSSPLSFAIVGGKAIRGAAGAEQGGEGAPDHQCVILHLFPLPSQEVVLFEGLEALSKEDKEAGTKARTTVQQADSHLRRRLIVLRWRLAFGAVLLRPEDRAKLAGRLILTGTGRSEDMTNQVHCLKFVPAFAIRGREEGGGVSKVVAFYGWI
jgi:hypothetical protein